MTFEIWAALAVVCITVYGLLKRWETRLVLLTSGFAMCLLALDPIAAFKQFDKSMTNASLIVVVCSAMGFARVMNITGCDLHLVRLLTKPLNRLGIALLPCCMIVTGVVSIAISSLAGMCAAIGPTICALDSRGFSAGNGCLYGDSFDTAVFLVARVFAQRVRSKDRGLADHGLSHLYGHAHAADFNRLHHRDGCGLSALWRL